MDFGELQIIGPQPLTTQHRTCISGQTCTFDGFRGLHLDEEDSLLLMDTCGRTVHGGSADFAWPTEAIPLDRLPQDGVRLTATQSLINSIYFPLRDS